MLKLTPLRIANIPPPMSMLELEVGSPAVDVAFSSSGTRLAVLSNRDFALFAFDMQKRPIAQPKLLWKSEDLEGHNPRQVAFVGDDRLCILTDVWDEPETFFWMYEGEQLVNMGPILEPGKVSSMTSDVEFSKALVTLRRGELTSVVQVETAESLQTKLLTNMPSFPPEVKMAVGEEQVSIQIRSMI